MVNITDDTIEPEEDFAYREFLKRATKISRKLKKIADQSGNPQTWHKGEPLDQLTTGMRERIETALRFGI